ncbi:helix-turn-helix transcriptional regulator [Mycolicibacterium sp. 050158]|uniref:helix-turn-helix domain-containing protein n=1 Tax=Mycolicibacterium sp. 050158 TaxID=3090602 RepID=UPI00299D77B2|nr:helix-turn-helix transcriptional regulator [Mycolicibacterium sp. 050158]MDX1889312.1 helix-turn-helix transcriptional regulator [Mycolicibacterium sp. 050158]
MSPESESADVEPLWRELAGRLVREERTSQGRTLGQVSQRAGISPQYLSEVERGLKEPSSEMLASICGALGLRLVDLLRAGDRHLARRRLRLASPTRERAARPPSGPVLLAA